MRVKSSLTVTALVAVGLAATPLSGARGDATGISLPITSYYQMAVDSGHGHLFISQGNSSENSILVTDFAGKTVTTITGQTGVKGITLSPDGFTLYAALSGAHAVTAISTSTLKQTASYSLGDAYTALGLAVQSGKLWVSYDTGTGNVGNAGIGDFDLTATSPPFVPQPAMGNNWYSAPLLAADPTGTGGVLVAIEPGMSPASVASYDTAQDPPAIRAQTNDLSHGGTGPGCDYAQDPAVVPGGAQFIALCAQASNRYSTADLSFAGAYPSGTFPHAMAMAAGTGLVAVPGSSGGVWVYRPDTDKPLNTYAPPQTLQNDGLGLTSNGSKLFVVTGNNASIRPSYYLNVYDNADKFPVKLVMHGPASVTMGSTVAFTGKFTFGGTPMPDGTAISVTRSGPDGTRELPSVTSTGGTFVLADKPGRPGWYRYTVSYPGDGSDAPASATLPVNVTGLGSGLTLTATPNSATFEPTVHLTAHLGATYTNRTVAIYAKPFSGNATFLLASGRVNSAGKLTVSYPARYNTTFTAVFSGDTRYYPKTVTVIISVFAKVTLTVSGSYGTTKVGSTTFRLFHRAARLNLAVRVAPNKHGQCVKIEIQEHYQAAWHSGGTSGCGHLSQTSTAAGYLTLSHADLGYGYRIRIDYIRSDAANLPADSRWQYFMVRK